MDLFTAIHTRRSVRTFTETPVSEEDIATMLEAAMVAPSAGNSQPWRFVVVDDQSILETAATLNPYAGMAKNAPLAILVGGDLTAEKHSGFWIQDCSAATQNLLLAATALGLGAVWTGIYPEQDRIEKYSSLFRLPEHIIPLSLVVIGHPKVTQEPKSRFNSENVKRNRWS